MDWSRAQHSTQRVWTNVRERTVFRTAPAPLHVRLMHLLTTALVIGLLVLVGLIGITVGLVVLLIIGAILLVRRAWRALSGGFASGGHAEQGRRNVRVIQRP